MATAARLALLALVFGSGGLAQPVPPGCDAALVQQANNAGLTQRYAPRGAYCDGRVVVPSSGSFPLLSVMMGSRTSPPQRGSGPIRLRIPALPQVGDRQLVVHGEQLARGGSWRLDGRMSSAGINVDRSAALAPMSLDESRIGFVATMLPARSIIVPLSLVGAPAETVWLVVRSPAPLRIVQMQVSGGAGVPYSRLIGRNFPSGQVISIPLDPEDRARVRTVKLVAAGAGSNRYSLTRSILIPGVRN